VDIRACTRPLSLSASGEPWPVEGGTIDASLVSGGRAMEDIDALTTLNVRFIEAFRDGSWQKLQPILSPSFRYLDGTTGEAWSHDRYVDNLDGHPSPSLAFDQLVIHVDGGTAVVSARTSRRAGRYSRYVDTYERRGDRWVCVHACLWPLEHTD
jgi:hypothetical protein